jgi:nitrous oxidase accessory protein
MRVSLARARVARLGFFAFVAFVAGSLTGSLFAPAPLAGQPVRAGPGEEFSTIGDAVASARAGDTVLVGPGTYSERLVIDRPLTLKGEGWPVIDGGGTGHVVEALAPFRLEGFVVRASGSNVEEEHAGVMVREAPGSRIVGNRLEDVFYGIYLKGSPGSLVRENRIQGKPFSPPRRGDGIRLWYSSASEILENTVIGTRDVVIYFSDSLLVRGNVIEGGRYGLHYMYSNHNVFERNRFDGNEVGAFLMYSADIRLRENVFANSAGMSGMGIGLKDSDAIEASGNLIVGNVVGIHLDNSPHSADVTNSFTGNLLLANQAGIRLLPSVRRNLFEGNDFLSNGTPVVVAGGAGPDQAARNDWSRNHWSEYRRPSEPASGARVVRSQPRARGAGCREPVLPVIETGAGRSGRRPSNRRHSSRRLGGGCGVPDALSTLPVEERLLAVPGGGGWRSAVARHAEETLVITGVGLGKSYGDQRVLGDLDFHIEAGERVALLGLNGAGKTTLFRCLLALTDFEGELRVAGETVTPGRKEVRRKIGYVPQQAPLYDMTLTEFVAFFSALRGVAMDGPASTLAALGMPLEETGAKALNELSGGMVQKALLGLALGSGSSVLLLDEPTANLDPGARRDLFRRVREIAAETTLLFASHRLDEIELLADRVLVLHGGGLAFDGTLEELWRATDAAPRLWLSAPAHEVERVAAELRE